MRSLLLVSVLAVVVSGCAGSSERVIVAAGTTLVDSGFLDEVVARYEADHAGVNLSVLPESTARVIDLGRRGAAGVLITHAPDLEAAFVAEGLARTYERVFTSRFVLVGPPGSTHELDGLTSREVLEVVSAEGRLFVTRNDGSGTHLAEQALWLEAGIDPTDEPWYVSTGQGMGLTLQVADQRGAFTFAEFGAFVAGAGTLDLVIVDTTDERSNPYSAIVVKGAPEAASEFVAWLSSEEGRSVVRDANVSLFGELVYEP